MLIDFRGVGHIHIFCKRICNEQKDVVFFCSFWQLAHSTFMAVCALCVGIATENRGKTVMSVTNRIFSFSSFFFCVSFEPGTPR